MARRAVGQGIFTTDADLVIRSWNRWLEEHTGLAAADVVGRPLFEVCPGARQRAASTRTIAPRSPAKPRVLAHRFHRYLIAARRRAARDAADARGSRRSKSDGAIVGTITVIDDVSERVASERELRARSRRRRRRAASPRRRSRVKDEFLATLSHEIRTPLNAVLGWTKILLGRQVDPAMLTRALQVIDRNAVAQARLIDDMLDMARIISGKLRLEMQPVDLARSRSPRSTSCRRRPTAKGITISTEDRRPPSPG